MKLFIFSSVSVSSGYQQPTDSYWCFKTPKTGRVGGERGEEEDAGAQRAGETSGGGERATPGTETGHTLTPLGSWILPVCSYEEKLRLCVGVYSGGGWAPSQRGAGQAGGGGVLKTQSVLCHRRPGRGGAAHWRPGPISDELSSL